MVCYICFHEDLVNIFSVLEFNKLTRKYSLSIQLQARPWHGNCLGRLSEPPETRYGQGLSTSLLVLLRLSDALIPLTRLSFWLICQMG